MKYHDVKQELIPLEKPSQWKRALTGLPHAFGHSWESCQAMYQTTNMPTYLYSFHAGDIKIVCPIAEREYEGCTDLTTPYGFSGFTGNGRFRRFPEIWREFMAGKGYTCGYFGLNPLFQKPLCYDKRDVYQSQSLYVLDLSRSFTELLRNMAGSRRQQLKQYDKLLDRLTTDKKTLKDFFLHNYHDFFARRKASSVYDLSLETLCSILDARNVLMAGVLERGEPQAVSVFAYNRYGAEYIFNISVGEGRKHSVPLLWYAVNYFKDLGVPSLNLGGGVSEGDSLAKFKKRFGGVRLAGLCLKQVYNKQAYSALCKSTGTDPENMTGYFPPYRKQTIYQLENSG